MTIQNWSDNIMVVELSEDPQFTEELASLCEDYDSKPTAVVLNFAAVGFLNSSNIARLLRVRKQVLAAKKRLILSGVNSQVFSVFQVTGLDRLFEFTNDISTALATLQLGAVAKLKAK